ncbi:MAG: inositol monophosphatase [Puniceicoccales bacterium]
MSRKPTLAIDWNRAAELLAQLEKEILRQVVTARNTDSTRALSGIAEVTCADTIYAVDKISETVICEWFTRSWPAEWPVELVMEGAENGPALTFPIGTPPEETLLKCLIDPIDGTRGLMYDKRSAWALAGLAPQRGSANTLRDIEVAVMTELPVSRQRLADQISAVRGQGIQARRIDLEDDSEVPVLLRPSHAERVEHAFGTVSRFCPEALVLLAQFEETLWRIVGEGSLPVVFNDQYISTGGQFYELLAGHDLFIADVRPLAFAKLGLPPGLVCHPYDVSTVLALSEGGCVIEQPDGSPLDGPMDTVTPVSWIAYANERLASRLRPAVQAAIAEVLL